MRRNCLFFFLGMMMSFVVSCSKQLNYEDIGVDMNQLQGEWYFPLARNAYDKVTFDGKTYTKQMFVDGRDVGSTRYPYYLKETSLELNTLFMFGGLGLKLSGSKPTTILALNEDILVFEGQLVESGRNHSNEILYRKKDSMNGWNDNDFSVFKRLRPQPGISVHVAPYWQRDTTFIIGGVSYPFNGYLLWDIQNLNTLRTILPEEFTFKFLFSSSSEGRVDQPAPQIEKAMIDVFNKNNQISYLHLATKSDGRESTFSDYLDYLNTPIKSITITADKEIGGIEAGESLNSLFEIKAESELFRNIAYSNRTKDAFIMSEGMDFNEFISTEPAGMSRFTLKFKSYEVIPSGDVTFHVRSVIVDGSSRESSVFVKFRQKVN